MMDRNLEIFIRVAEYGSFTTASQVLYISQPAVSHAIKHLEAELKVQLFYRDKRTGLILTEVGEKILSYARQMEDINNRILQTAYQENNLISGRLRIASLPSLTSTYVSQTLRVFHERYPNVKIEIKEGSPQEIREMLEGYMVDLAFSTSPYNQFDFITIKQDEMVAASRENRGKSNALDLSHPDETVIITKPAYETIMDNTSKGNFIDMGRVIIVQNISTLLNMVNDKIGVGIISKHPLSSSQDNFYIRELIPPVKFDIGVFAADLKELTPVAKEFICLLKEII